MSDRHDRRALAIHEKLGDVDTRYGAEALGAVGTDQRLLGRFSEARAALERALAIRERQLGRDHPVVAGNLVELSRVALAQRRAADAVALAERGMSLYDAAFGPTREEAVEARSVYTRALLAAGQAARALAAAAPAVDAAASLAPEFRVAARFDLARALVAAGKDRKRACALATEARALAAGTKDAGDPAEIAKWMKGAACPASAR